MRAGRYGPYVNQGKVNATLPKTLKPEDVTLEQALELIVAKGGASPKLKKPARAPGLTAPEHAAYCAWVGQHDPEEFRQSAIACVPTTP